MDVQGRIVISVGGGSVLPLFISLDVQAGAARVRVAAHDWTSVDYELQLAASTQIRVPLLEVCLLDTTPAVLTELAQQVAVFPACS
jgi:hypothetical protein